VHEGHPVRAGLLRDGRQRWVGAFRRRGTAGFRRAACAHTGAVHGPVDPVLPRVAPALAWTLNKYTRQRECRPAEGKSRLPGGELPHPGTAIALGPAYTPFAGVYLFSVHANAGATRGRTDPQAHGPHLCETGRSPETSGPSSPEAPTPNVGDRRGGNPARTGVLRARYSGPQGVTRW